MRAGKHSMELESASALGDQQKGPGEHAPPSDLQTAVLSAQVDFDPLQVRGRCPHSLL